MTIKKCLKTKGLRVEVKAIKKFSVLNIGFIGEDGFEDETQIDVDEDIRTQKGKEKIEEIWESIAAEMPAKKDSVEYITVVCSTDTEEEAIAAGY